MYPSDQLVSDGILLFEIPAHDFNIFPYKLAFLSLASLSFTVCNLSYSNLHFLVSSCKHV